MTRKRYIKLCYALMQKMNEDSIKTTGHGASNWKLVLNGAKRLHFKNMNHDVIHSYAEAWEFLKPIRTLYKM